MTNNGNVGIGLEKKLSPEEVHDIKQEVRERYPSVPWPDLTQERVYVAGYDFAIPGVLSNCIQKKIDEEHKLWSYAVDGMIPEHVAFCSDQYNFVPFEVASKVFLNFLDSYDQWGKPKVSFQIIDGGRKMKAYAQFDEHTSKLKGKAAKVNDVISPVGGFYHGIDLDWQFRVFAGALRLLCTNGMVGHRLNLELGAKHKSTLDITQMVQGLAPTFEKYGEQLDIWNSWGATTLTPPQVDDLVLSSGFGTKHQEEIKALPEKGTGETLEQWMQRGQVNMMNLFNVLTQFTTHELDSELVKVKRGEQIAEAFETFKFKKAA